VASSVIVHLGDGALHAVMLGKRLIGVNRSAIAFEFISLSFVMGRIGIVFFGVDER
jgi:hypothetical protein